MADAKPKYDVKVNAYSDTTCSTKADVKNKDFTTNDECKAFKKPEAGFKSTSKKGVPDGCVLQVFSDTTCSDVLAAITINAGCEAPILGPAQSAKLAGC